MAAAVKAWRGSRGWTCSTWTGPGERRYRTLNGAPSMVDDKGSRPGRPARRRPGSGFLSRAVPRGPAAAAAPPKGPPAQAARRVDRHHRRGRRGQAIWARVERVHAQLRHARTAGLAASRAAPRLHNRRDLLHTTGGLRRDLTTTRQRHRDLDRPLQRRFPTTSSASCPAERSSGVSRPAHGPAASRESTTAWATPWATGCWSAPRGASGSRCAWWMPGAGSAATSSWPCCPTPTWCTAGRGRGSASACRSSACRCVGLGVDLNYGMPPTPGGAFSSS